ncbi:glycosyltransferase family 4 protein [Tropicibacter naphthalenivorans]|uniref:Glycogen/starch synthase, ADP-glucose type n=1 Tax=Tropicibacter naphthalenivorans TaxID=441103 RepID=A0A0N7M191_9RHOB|nr:glycosyltransferase family 4 protein [Tropicibacter naphthalenivorans]CUH82609.1 glycogen/starch synthase, ADP-glucose type [Tropicibacter naphthalenivorans]SMD09058.1 Glycosyltransferase involved in cell wall bisynthesis [Tropicibacter naphthalenivorans]
MQLDDFDVKTFPAIDTVGLSTADHRLRVCIVTEEIIGPVRNGGIASTYYHLSKGLAAHGHDVHVLFLKGPVVQDETPEHWVQHFAEFGVTLHYLQVPERPIWSAATEWQERFAAAYQWLRDQETFDVVHTSEWRGGMVYALMAKRLGLAFQETLFLVKTSSPHIWNRHYQMQPIERRELVLAAYAEQKCVELADAVIGGSAHLITFMEQIGYKVPGTNVFVQPNIVDFSKVIVTDQRQPRGPGEVMHTQEVIFFGRLEGRKGVELMCNALDILKERGVAPSRMTFMGKWGAPLATQGGMKVEDYLNAKAENWDFPVEYITDKNQPEALSHMCSRDMIAVMPSLIENSTMAVYETLENNIPFIATAVGGTPELIDPIDHDRCLVAPKATALADQLQRALEEGQPIAHSSFSNDENLRVWYGFHAHVGERIAQLGRREAITQITAGMDHPGTPVKTISFAVLVRRGDSLADLVAALRAEAPDRVVLGFTEAALRADVQTAEDALRSHGIETVTLDCIGQAAGDALNMLARAHGEDALVIAHGAGTLPRPGFFAAARAALTHRPGCLFTTFFEAQDDVLGMPMGGDVASHFLSSRAYGPELFAMRTETYERIGSFEPYDVRQGILHEYVTRAVEAGPDDLLVYPEELLSWPQAFDEARELADDTVYAYLKAKPLIDKSSLSQRKITLAALHHVRSSGGALGDKVLRDGGRDEEEPLWLMPVDWNRTDITQPSKRALIVALDEASNTLWLYARGAGDRRLSLRDTAQTIALVESHGAPEDENHVTLSSYELPAAWEVGTSYPISWGLYENDHKLRNQFLRINKISENTFALAARNPILTKGALQEIIARQREAARIEAALGAQAQAVLDAAGATSQPSESTDIDALLAMTGSDPAPQETRPKPLKKADLDKGTDLDDLLSLAQVTGRAGLERQSLRSRSSALIDKHAGAAPSDQGDIRSFLNPAKSAEAWAHNGWLIGWAWDRTDPERTLHVAVLRDGVPIFMVTADTHMPALGRRTPGLENHGFRIPVGQDFLEAGALSLVVWESRSPVRNGALIVPEAGDALQQAPETTR